MSCEEEDTQGGSDIGVVESAKEKQRREEADIESGMDLLWTQSGQRKKKRRLLRGQLSSRPRRNRRSSVKKEEEDCKQRKSIDESQSIQITTTSDFIKQNRENIKTGWGGYFGVPVPVVAATIFLNLANMEDFVLSKIVRGKTEEGTSKNGVHTRYGSRT